MTRGDLHSEPVVVEAFDTGGFGDLRDAGTIDLTDAALGRHPRPQVSVQRFGEDVGRELQRSARSKRPGVLAAVSFAEWDRLHSRLGSHSDFVLTAVFDEAVGVESDALEEHCQRSGGGFFVLLPETSPEAGALRLRRLARRLGQSVVDIDGEHVRVTPVVGYTVFAGGETARDLRQQTAHAMDDAHLHLDLQPVRFSPAMVTEPPPVQDRLIALTQRLTAPAQVLFTFALLLCLPFIAYTTAWSLGVDLTRITYPLVAVALTFTAGVLWVECFRAAGAVDLPPEPTDGYPSATAIIAAYLPNEAATIVDTVESFLRQNYPGELQIVLAYNTPQHLPVEDVLTELAAANPRLLLLRVPSSVSKAQNINAALAHVRGEFVGVFDADHHPEQGSFARAWRWLAQGHHVVQGHCVVRNGEASWVARLVAVEFESVYAVSHPGRARLHGFGIFGGSNGYWRTDSLRQIRMQGGMLTEDIDSSMRGLLEGFSLVSDPGLLSTELAPTTLRALWHQRMRWAQGWAQTAKRHLRPALTSDLGIRQKTGAAFLLGWTQVVPWVTVQVFPILAFEAWRHHGLSGVNFFIPLFVLMTIFTFSVGIGQTFFAFGLGDQRLRQRPWWFVVYATHSMLWFGELKNVISRVAQVKELMGERQWRVTPRSTQAEAAGGQRHS